MPFVEIGKMEKPPKADRLYVHIGGALTIPKQARAALGAPQYVNVLFDEKSRKILVKPSDNSGRRVHRSIVSIGYFAIRCGIPHGRYEASLANGGLLVDLSKRAT